jgi:HTH-type transcriptional regulator / antitoxin HipB
MILRTATELGAMIRQRRKKLHLDQLSVAKRAGTSRQWIVAIEQGKPRAAMGLVLRTLQVLGLSLFADEGPGPNRQLPSGPRTPASIDINQIVSSLRRKTR